jgi:transcriptional regulator with XRE-family HTH domain
MSIVTRIKLLADERKMTIAELERKLDFSNGSIRRWDKQSPSVDRLQKVADFFNVTADSLLGRNEENTSPKAQSIARRYDKFSSDQQELLDALFETVERKFEPKKK